MIPVPIQPYLDQLDALLRVAHDLAADEAGYTVELESWARPIRLIERTTPKHEEI